MMSSIRIDFTTRPLETLVDDVASGAAQIPEHQREFCWPISRQVKLVETIQRKMPMPPVIIRTEGTETTIEDGLQRLTTARRYMNNDFPNTHGVLFRDLPVLQQVRFMSYSVPVLTYTNATKAEAIRIFNMFQNGSPLSTGERLHSLSSLSRLVSVSKKLLLTAGTGFHDRASPLWGVRSGADSRRNNLLQACALIAGLAFGIDRLSKKWTDFEEHIEDDIDEDAVNAKLEIILNILEQVQRLANRKGKAQKNFLWNWGKTVGYIAYSLSLTDAQLPLPLRGGIASLSAAWIAKLVELRDNAEFLEVVEEGASKARSWNIKRWRRGVQNLFGAMPDAEPESQDDDETETTETEEED